MHEQIATRMVGNLVVLEPIAPGHEAGLRAAAADPAAWEWTATRDVDLWIEQAYAEAAARTRYPFAVLREGTPVGSTSYMSLASEHERLEIGHTWLSPSAWGSGANTEAKYLLLCHAFEALGCLRVEFKTDALNGRARAALAGLPAEFEGIHRRHMVVRGGERRDSAWYSVIVDDWPAVRASLEARLARY
jgi:N-acetyltransferase